jgi:hypothetical protein
LRSSSDSSAEIERQFSIDDYAIIDPDFDDYDPAALLTRGEIDGYTSNWYGDHSLDSASYQRTSPRHYAPFRIPIPDSAKPSPKAQPQPELVRAWSLAEPKQPSWARPEVIGGVGFGGWFPIASAPLDGWPVWLGRWRNGAAGQLHLFEGVWDRGNREWRSLRWEYLGHPTIWRHGAPSDWGEERGPWGWLAAAKRAMTGAAAPAMPDESLMPMASASDLSAPAPPPSPSQPSTPP